ncbi:MAG: transposase [Planctomycetota bacterium]
MSAQTTAAVSGEGELIFHFQKRRLRDFGSPLIDEHWEIVSESIPQARKSRKGRRPRSVEMREVLNTIFYQCRIRQFA